MNITTTYRDDYEWPFVKSFPIPPITFEFAPQVSQEPGEFISNERLQENVPKQECKMPPKSDAYEWSRLGPMGFLLEPKLYPVNTDLNICAGKSMKFNDVKNWMKSLGESLTLQEPSMPGYDTLRMIHEDRLKTTYQLDYDHLAEYPYLDYDTEIKQQEKLPEIECRVPVKLPYIGGHDIPGRPPRPGTFDSADNNSHVVQNVERRTTTPAEKSPEAKVNQGTKTTEKATEQKVTHDTKSKEKIVKTTDTESKVVSKPQKKANAKSNEKRNAKPIQTSPGNATNAQMQSIEPWTSEYCDVIGYTADEIIRNKLHCTTKKCKEGK